eukprot:7604365-Lingulodinium_polyedra.AAC.1
MAWCGKAWHGMSWRGVAMRLPERAADAFRTSRERASQTAAAALRPWCDACMVRARAYTYP